MFKLVWKICIAVAALPIGTLCGGFSHGLEPSMLAAAMPALGGGVFIGYAGLGHGQHKVRDVVFALCAFGFGDFIASYYWPDVSGALGPAAFGSVFGFVVTSLVLNSGSMSKSPFDLGKPLGELECNLHARVFVSSMVSVTVAMLASPMFGAAGDPDPAWLCEAGMTGALLALVIAGLFWLLAVVSERK